MKRKKEAKKKVKHPPIDGVETYCPGTKILTREYRVRSGIKD